jgi:predicted kinase
MKAQLVLIRGLPGSGKTTLAKRKYADYQLLEADMWHEVDGAYVFEQNQLANAHKWCQLHTEKLLREGKFVVVANTFITKSEIIPYVEIAIRAGVSMKIDIAEGDYKSIHDVPAGIVDLMGMNWEQFDLFDLIGE